MENGTTNETTLIDSYAISYLQYIKYPLWKNEHLLATTLILLLIANDIASPSYEDN